MSHRALVGIIGMVALVAACSDSSTNGTSGVTPSSSPMSVSTETPPATSTLPFAGAPKVAVPLPSSALSGDPCTDALTTEQVMQALGAQVQGEPNKIDKIGPSCEWFNRDTTGKVTVTFVTETRVGLSGLYQNSKSGDSSWKELPLMHGFPAVAHNKVTSSCQVSIGFADDRSVDVTTHLGLNKGGGKTDPCEVAPQVAELVVATLKKKAGA
ncbi:DUF3558 domain-containing protein [Amycolatopsis sp. lyj-108]|uniref:DUF3558 domain-containing protein n=1 Tax=Amycolatopsis sp. lyj-108 TaxID=2789286 RepID=UPI00397DD3A6